MGRIPDEEIERLKAEVSLERLVSAAGVELRRVGSDLVGCCPFHDDREPSLVVSPGKNLWHCMGACQVGGSVIDWVMRAEGVSFRHAVELLRDGRAGVEALAGPAPTRSSVRKLPSPLQRTADDFELLGQVVGFYHQTLLESPEALAYLQARRVDNPEVVATFQLGYANRTLGYRLPNKQRREGAEVRGRLQRLGVLRESGHEHRLGAARRPATRPPSTTTIPWRRTIMTTPTSPSTTVAEPRIRAELRIPIDASEAPIAFEDTYPEATDLAVEMAGPAGLLATLVLPIDAAREWAGELFTAVSVAYREVTGDPHALTDHELQSLPPADEYNPGAGLIVHGDEREPARARFHIEVEIEAEFLSTAGLRAALVEALSERFNTTRVAVSAGEATTGTILQFPDID